MDKLRGKNVIWFKKIEILFDGQGYYSTYIIVNWLEKLLNGGQEYKLIETTFS